MKNKKLNIKNLIKFNKYTFLLLFIYCLLGIGVTYAYLAFRVENNSVITGNVIAIDVELEVDLVVGTNDDMVPLNGDALSNALNGVGSTNGACVDNVGNLSCQVYKITLNNIGSRIKHINGTIELYAKDGQGNVYNNLMWREITNPTTIKEDAIFHTMEKSKLVSDLTMESKEVKVWYIAIWINEIEENQLDTDKGDFGGIVTFESFEVKENAFVEEVMEPNAQSDNNIDFSVGSNVSGTNGIYLRSGTENDTYPIYYYRGNVNNNLIFAEFCWKVVRTTETGGLKLIYNGLPSNSQCNNTGETSQIGTSKFNNSYSPIAIGYMYSTENLEIINYLSMSGKTENYYYGNDVTYSNGNYTLVNTISSNNWSSIYSGGLNNYHYTCLSTGTTCSEVNYIIQTESSRVTYIKLKNGKKIEDAINEYFGSDDKNIKKYNTISSLIKGNKDTVGSLDNWYYTNIEQKGYSNYIEDTIWCTDRTIYQKNSWDPNGGNTTNKDLYFSGYYRRANGIVKLDCERNVDSFTVSKLNGNGALDYPVGLLTSDEAMMAGGSKYDNPNYYLYTSKDYFLINPAAYQYSDPNLFRIRNSENPGYINSAGAANSLNGVRPSISLKPGFSLTGNGNGSTTSPYIVQ